MNSDDDISQCWYRWRRVSPHLVLVEDQPSAIKLAAHVDAISLLGTNLSEAKVDEIISTKKYDKIFLCLDNDATGTAVKLVLKWKSRLPQLEVKGLGKDIKDMSDEEFQDFLRAIEPDKESGTSSTLD